MFFTSPTSNILSGSCTSTAMSRSDSRDSATSTASASHFPTRTTVTYSPVLRPATSHSAAALSVDFPSSHRRTSSSSSSSSNSAWHIPSPYRSCLAHATGSPSLDEPSSYLSDDDLLYLSDHDLSPTSNTHYSHAGAALAAAPTHRELTTEEQIAMLQALRDQEASHAHQQPQHGMAPAMLKPECWAQQRRSSADKAQRRARMVRFTGESERRDTHPSRRGSYAKKRPSGLRRVN